MLSKCHIPAEMMEANGVSGRSDESTSSGSCEDGITCQ